MALREHRKMGIYETSERNLEKNCRCDCKRYAEENHADVIVFSIWRSLREDIRKEKTRNCTYESGIYRGAVDIRHTEKGMRVSRICAWNTSRLAYDGSGSNT